MKYKDNMFYLTGTNVSINEGLLNYDYGSSPDDFNENKFIEFCNKDDSQDLQGSHWAPHLIHKDLWLESADLVKNSTLEMVLIRFCMKLGK